ncbi:glycosyltransferase family 4 protein [Cohnella mopanensis]|uniref:glycosyltransferase family 4 protein n=1 Tax=Cohnella mopanensis TaxID=2911966 RepID=UPI001EF8DE5B|nr:glycosyltransferase [Cohnella mopanensis]
MSETEGDNAAPKTVLTLVPYFEPGYKAGGPITTIRNSVDHLFDKVKFKIITSDRDLGDKHSYPLPLNRWIPGVPDRYYLSGRNGIKLIRIMRETNFDVVYLNSFFSFQYSVLPVIWNKCFKVHLKRTVLAPRGEFSEGALSIKPLKKKIFIALAKWFGIYSDVIWQASSVQEEAEIVKVFGPKALVIVAPDFPSSSKPGEEPVFRKMPKQRGSLRLVFLSRICKMKNLKFAISILRNVKGEVQFDIFGPIEDEHYWEECLTLIRELTDNIKVNYLGAVTPAKVKTILGSYDLFILPTLGEGFGHAIFEALQTGCPVVISDRTPWGEVARSGGGMVISLDKPEDFALSLQRYVNMDFEEHAQASLCALEFSSNYLNNIELLNSHLSLFE